MVQVHDFWDVNTRTKPYERITTFEKPTEGGGEGGGGVERLTWSHGTGQDVIPGVEASWSFAAFRCMDSRSPPKP